MITTLSELTDFLSFACQNTHHTSLGERSKLAETMAVPFAPAAVLLPFEWHDNQAHIWLTQRSSQLRQHGGQVAFPGGKCDYTDANAIATALRETEEELGSAAEHWQIIGQLQRCAIPTGFMVHPVVALRRMAQPWQPNAQEVASVFAVPLSYVLDLALYQTRMVEHWGRAFTVYNLPFEQYDIWGATAAMLHHLAELYAYWEVSQPYKASL